MKTTLATLLIFSLLSCKIGNKEESISTDNKSVSIIDFSPNTNSDIMVSAHRGGGVDMEHWPENCLETMQHLHEKGITIFEIDVAETLDSKLVLMHDKKVNRTTDGSGEVSIKSWSELENLQLKDDFDNLTDFHIPLFSEVLKWAKKNKVYLTVDLKNVDEQLIINTIEKQGAEKNCALIAYTVEQAIKLNELAPDLMLSVPMRNSKEVDRMLETDIPTNRMIAFTGTRKSAKGLNQKINDLGIMVIFGTLGNIDRRAERRGEKIYHEFMDDNVQIFATDRPLATQQAIEYYEKKS